MALTLQPVTTKEDKHMLARVANEIWHEYWPAHIGQAQTDYMVDRFQSLDAITDQIEHQGFTYWLLYNEDEKLAGYTGGIIEHIDKDPSRNVAVHHFDTIDAQWQDRFFISKIYLYDWARGRHYASRIIEFYDRYCQERNLPAMYLTVNRSNDLAIRAYLGRGFSIVEEVDSDIGNGFVLTDYVAAKTLSNDPVALTAP